MVATPHPTNDLAKRIVSLEDRNRGTLTIWNCLHSASGEWEALFADGTLIKDPNPAAFLGRVIARLTQMEAAAEQAKKEGGR